MKLKVKHTALEFGLSLTLSLLLDQTSYRRKQFGCVCPSLGPIKCAIISVNPL